ncbi:MAG: hypothetical protein O2829_08465 [Bacteroidetes bacterium]|nr:hypothetical protein [Bacteroidota bacterium]MDA1269109.1 hypothetical protein [Bacteroidota bacterium]
MRITKTLQILTLFFVFTLPGEAQGFTDLDSISQTRLDYNQKGMFILGTWALVNLVWGALGSFRTKGQRQAFHQMNAYWNVVNLGIAGFGFWQATQLSVLNFWDVLAAQQQIEKVLLANAALDFGYLVLGLFLIERGRRLEKDKWIGFGKSILLQGAFLLLFDAVLYGFQQQLGIELVELGKGMATLFVK